MCTQRRQHFSQTETNENRSAKQASITSPTPLTVRSITAHKIINIYVEPPAGYTDLFFNVSTVSVMSLTTLLIQMMQPVSIDQGCKMQTNLSLGSYSSSKPHLRVESTLNQNGSITRARI